MSHSTQFKKTRLALTIGAALSAPVFVQPANAACTPVGTTYTVNVTSDITAADSDTTLREAVEAANASGGCDAIAFDPSVDVIFLSAANGKIDITDSLNIDGPGSDDLVIVFIDDAFLSFGLNASSGDVDISGISIFGNSNSMAFPSVGVNTGGSFIADDIVVANLIAPGGTDGRQGMYLSCGSATISNSRFENNRSSGITGSCNSTTLINVTATDNGQNGVSVSGTDLSLDDVTATGNASRGINASGTNITISNSTATGNTGGGVSVSTSGTGLIEYSTISGNTTTGNGAGINISTFSGGGVTVSKATIDGNSADSSGGGIYYSPGGSSGSLTIDSSTISNNETLGALDETSASTTTDTSGGGIFVDNATSAYDLAITQSTISGNTTNAVGGGIYIGDRAASTMVNIQHSTIANNIAAYGGGLFSSSATPDPAVNISHTVIAANTAPVSANTWDADISVGSIHLFQNFVQSSYSMVGVNNYYFNDLGGTVTGTYGTGIPLDAMLAALGDGPGAGATEVHYPLTGSPLIDAGDPAIPAPPPTDQDERTRIVNSTIDIGSIEYSGNVGPAAVAVAPTTISSGLPYSLDLTTAFTDANTSDVLTYSILNPADVPPSLVLTGSVASANLAFADVGSFTVQYQACDAEPLCATNDVSLTITNQAPTLDVAVDTTTANVGTAYSINLDDYFSDPNGDPITYAITNINVPATLSITGSIASATFTSADIGSYTIDYRACDPEPLCVMGQGVLTVQAAPAASSGSSTSPVLLALLASVLGLFRLSRKR